jgi:hypothetical protein
MTGYRPYFEKIIRRNYLDKASHLITKITQAFNKIEPDVRFGFLSKNPVDRRMEVAGYFLATIQVLDQEGEDFNKIRTVLTDIAHEYVRPKNKFQAFLKRLPPKLIATIIGQLLLKQFAKRAGTRSHPEGFVAKIITDKKETREFGYGIDILECGICKLYTKHNYGKYASILCDVDHITSGMAGLKLFRTGTIANGAHKCDFRFERV